MEALGKLNIRDRQGEGSYPFKTLRISSLFTTATVSSVAVGKDESFSARVVGPVHEEGTKLGNVPGTLSHRRFGPPATLVAKSLFFTTHIQVLFRNQS